LHNRHKQISHARHHKTIRAGCISNKGPVNKEQQEKQINWNENLHAFELEVGDEVWNNVVEFLLVGPNWYALLDVFIENVTLLERTDFDLFHALEKHLVEKRVYLFLTRSSIAPSLTISTSKTPHRGTIKAKKNNAKEILIFSLFKNFISYLPWEKSHREIKK
jgi:hypothetical protein